MAGPCCVWWRLQVRKALVLRLKGLSIKLLTWVTQLLHWLYKERACYSKQSPRGPGRL